MVKTYADLYLDARKALLPSEGMYAGTIARELVCAASGKTQEALIADRSLYASEEICLRVANFVNRHLTGEPTAYILGQWDFADMTLTVTPDVLIPRDDSMAVTELAIKKALFLPQNPRILDLCTGSGAKKPAAHFLGRFDLIVSNPPYVTTAEMEELDASVKDFEPHLALHGGEDGLDFYRAIVRNFTPALREGGFLALEFGMGQDPAVCAILEAADYKILELKEDNSGIVRAVLAQHGEEE